MKSIGCLATAIVFLLGLSNSHWAAQSSPEMANTDRSHKVLVRFRANVKSEGARGIASTVGARILKSFEIVDNLHVLEVPAGTNTDTVLARLRGSSDVLYAERDQIRVAYTTTPNDPSFDSLWGMAKIQAPEAWDTTQGSDQVVVAVIDTGIDYSHEDLAGNMWRNPGEVPGDGVDNDGNGYVDDIHGIDAADGDSDPMDTMNCEHGTHVSGTIGAVGNNGIGVVGVNWVVRLMAVRCGHYDPNYDNCVFEDSASIESIQYLAMMKDRGVNIVAANASYGGLGYGQSIRDAIEQGLTRRGILLVAAAGNDIPGIDEAKDNDVQPSYPASYYLPNIISVMATNQSDGRPSWSYVGDHSVHVGGTGGSNTLSTVPGNRYASSGWMGTSMAAPHVAGLVALLKAQDQTRDWKALKALVMSGGDRVSGTQSNTISGNRINANGSVNCSGRTVLNHVLPRSDLFAGTQEAIQLAELSTECGQPNPGAGMAVTTPDGQVQLADNGNSGDMAAGDGVFSGSYVAPRFPGTYTLGFPGNDDVALTVLRDYDYSIIPSQYESISGGTAYLAGKDEGRATLSPPFPIVFGGVPFTQLSVTPNGVFVFGQYRLLDALPVQIPPTGDDVDGWDAIIAPFWDDLEFARTNSAVYAATVGSSPYRKYVLEWRNAHPWTPANECTAETVTFQVVFTEGSQDILFNYQETSIGGDCADHDRGGLASVGILVGRHTGTQFSYLSPSLLDGMSILWSYDCPAISISPQELQAATVGRAYSQAITAQGGTPPYAYSVSAGSLPSGITFNTQTGALSGTPTYAGVSRFTVSVQDAMACTGRRDYTFIVNGRCTTTVSPPVLPPGTVGVAYEQTIVASGDAPPYYYLVEVTTPLPPDLGLDPVSGVLSGVPTSEGTYSFCVQVMDGRFCSVYQHYVLQIRQPCSPLSVVPETLPAGVAGFAYSQTVSAVDGIPPYSYVITAEALPPGLGLSSSTGEISGTPTTGGTYSFTVTATDFLSCTGSRQYTIEVARCPTIVVNPQMLGDGAVGIDYSQTVSASGGTPPYAYLVSSGQLPPGLTLDALSGTLAGVPTAEGTYVFTVTATDRNSCVGTKAYSLDINNVPCPPITVLPGIMPDGQVGTAYAQQLTATGGTAPYAFAVSSGAMPAGLVLDPNGAISGTPSTVGAFTFTLTATDAEGCHGSQPYAVTIVGAAAMPDLMGLPGAKAELSRDGKSVWIRFRGMNRGNAGAGRFPINVYLSKSPTLGSRSKLIKTRIIRRLAAGGTTRLMELTYERRSSLAGSYVMIRFDPANSIAESDESNNMLTLHLSQ